VASEQPDITAMLAAWNDGDAGALNCLMELVYPKVRGIAHQHLARRRAGESVEETAQVLRVSADTVKRDWRMACAWLLAELER
jgi:hypothetical protein